MHMNMFRKARGLIGLGKYQIDTPVSSKTGNVGDNKLGVRPKVHTGAPPNWRTQIDARNAPPTRPPRQLEVSVAPHGKEISTPSPLELNALINAHFGNAPQSWQSKLLLKNALSTFEKGLSTTEIATIRPLLIEHLASLTNADASHSTALISELQHFDPLQDIATSLQNKAGAPETASSNQADAWRLATFLTTHATENPGIKKLLCQSLPENSHGHFLAFLGQVQHLLTTRTSSPLTSILQQARKQSGASGNNLTALAPKKADPAYALINAMRSASPDMSVLVSTHFPSESCSPQISSTLTHAIEQAAREASGTAPKGLPGAPAVLITQALAAATGGDAAHAMEALSTLRSLDPVSVIQNAWNIRQQDASEPTVDSTKAWHLARELVTTPSGFDVLQAILGKAVPEAQKRNFTTLLKAISVLPVQTHTSHYADTPAAHETSPYHTPLSALQQASLPHSIPGQAILCASACLAGDEINAHHHAWAFNAVRNELYESGPKSDLAKINSWLQKTGKWITRAENDTGIRLRNPLSGNSAFRALRHGTQQVERATALTRHQKAFDQHLRKASGNLQALLIAHAPYTRAVGPGRVSNTILRAAVLAHCQALPPDICMDRYKLTPEALADVRVRVNDLIHQYGSPANNASIDAQALNKQVQAFEGHIMSMEVLKQWFEETQAHSIPGTAEADAAHTAAISENLKKAHIEAYGKDTRIENFDKEKFRLAMKDVIAQMDGSSRLRLSSGGVLGVGLRQVTATLSSLVSGLFIRGRIDARKQIGNHAVFEIAMTTYDMEIVIGRQRQSAHQFGLGGSVGPNLGIAKAGGGTDAVLYGRGTSEIEGISLRIPRIGRPVPEVRAEFAKLFDRLLDGPTATPATPESSHTSASGKAGFLPTLLQEFPTLVVNRIGQASEARTRHGLSLEGSASVKVPFARATAGVSVSTEVNSSQTKHYQDASGGMKIDRQVKGWSAKAGIGAKIGAGLNLDASATTLSSGNTDLGVSASLDVLNTGHNLRRETVYQSGRMLPVSFIEEEYQNAHAFANHVTPQLDKWSQARAACGENRQASMEKANLEKFLHEVQDQSTPMHSYGARNMLAPDAVARINMLESCKALAQRQAPASPARLTQEMSSAFLDANEAEWNAKEKKMPYSLRSYKRVTTQTGTGINFGIQLGTQHLAEGSHIDNRYDVS